jgi:hypothetical protein
MICIVAGKVQITFKAKKYGHFMVYETYYVLKTNDFRNFNPVRVTP